MSIQDLQQDLQSDLLIDLSTEEQQDVSGGWGWGAGLWGATPLAGAGLWGMRGFGGYGMRGLGGYGGGFRGRRGLFW